MAPSEETNTNDDQSSILGNHHFLRPILGHRSLNATFYMLDSIDQAVMSVYKFRSHQVHCCLRYWLRFALSYPSPSILASYLSKFLPLKLLHQLVNRIAAPTEPENPLYEGSTRANSCFNTIQAWYLIWQVYIGLCSDSILRDELSEYCYGKHCYRF
eukprot:237767_1